MLIYVWTYNGEKFEKTHVIDYAESVIWVATNLTQQWFLKKYSLPQTQKTEIISL